MHLYVLIKLGKRISSHVNKRRLVQKDKERSVLMSNLQLIGAINQESS